jgi:hypothetical protein
MMVAAAAAVHLRFMVPLKFISTYWCHTDCVSQPVRSDHHDIHKVAGNVDAGQCCSQLWALTVVLLTN